MGRTIRRAMALLLGALVVTGCVGLGVLRAGADGKSHAAKNAASPSRARAMFVEQWRRSFPVDFVGLPSVDSAGVVATAGESQVLALSPTGALQWTTAVEGALANAPRLDGDRVFVAAKRAVVALDRASGAVVWSVPTAADGQRDDRANQPVVVGDVVVVTTESGDAYGLDRGTGISRWSVALPTATTAEPAATNGVAVVVGIGQWWALDPTSGAALCSGDIGTYGTSSPVVYADGPRAVAAVATDGHVLAVDARSGEGIWDAEADQSEYFQVPTVSAAHELLVPDHWGRLAAFDAHDGTVRWRVRGANAIAEFGEPAVLGPKLVAMSLDAGGPRIAGPAGSYSLKVPAPGHGVARAPGGLLIVTTWDGPQNYVVAYRLKARSGR